MVRVIEDRNPAKKTEYPSEPDKRGGWRVWSRFLVPEAGIEPACPFYGRQILSLLCLPISPLGLAQTETAALNKSRQVKF